MSIGDMASTVGPAKAGTDMAVPPFEADKEEGDTRIGRTKRS
jgi:hypothetical protein